jgi:SAM-dependent methyltransferase
VSWFVKSFGARYRQLYSHRDEAEAERTLALLEPSSGWSARLVLDLACGAGRYGRALRRRGATPIGLDLSPVLLAEARSWDPSSMLLRADMRKIPLSSGSVDDCLSMFTSFGYFDTVSEHALLAAEMARVSRGRIVVDIPNPVALQRNLVPRSERELDGFLLREIRWLKTQPAQVCKRMELVDASGVVDEEYEESVMLFERSQLVEFFEPHGFALRRCHGSYAGEDFVRDESPRQICVFALGEA